MNNISDLRTYKVSKNKRKHERLGELLDLIIDYEEKGLKVPLEWQKECDELEYELYP